MSETSTGLLEPPAPELEAEESSSGTDRKRLLLVVGGAVGVVVVGLLAWLLLAGGGETPEDGLVAAAPQAPAAAPEEPAAAPEDEQVPESFDGELGRDPFTPIYEPEAAAAGTGEVAPEAGTSGGGAVTDPAAAGTPVSVTVIEVAGDGATVSVDGESFDATTDGSTFAEVFRLYSTFDERCAGLLYGDQSVVLCEGDTRTLST
jgi:hypothetical protein